MQSNSNIQQGSSDYLVSWLSACRACLAAFWFPFAVISMFMVQAQLWSIRVELTSYLIIDFIWIPHLGLEYVLNKLYVRVWSTYCLIICFIWIPHSGLEYVLYKLYVRVWSTSYLILDLIWIPRLGLEYVLYKLYVRVWSTIKTYSRHKCGIHIKSTSFQAQV